MKQRENGSLVKQPNKRVRKNIVGNNDALSIFLRIICPTVQDPRGLDPGLLDREPGALTIGQPRHSQSSSIVVYYVNIKSRVANSKGTDTTNTLKFGSYNKMAFLSLEIQAVM